MIQFQFEPDISAAKNDEAFVQTVRMIDGKTTIGVAHWHCAADATKGIVQITDLEIAPAFRRAGHGKRLLQAVREQAAVLHRNRKKNFRRIWIGVEQKSQVIARAFLTAGGFHHVATMSELFRDQDLMIYVKSVD